MTDIKPLTDAHLQVLPPWTKKWFVFGLVIWLVFFHVVLWGFFLVYWGLGFPTSSLGVIAYEIFVFSWAWFVGQKISMMATKVLAKRYERQ